MSRLEEKLVPYRPTEGRAQRGLKTLKSAGRYAVLAGSSTRPDRVAICPMDHRSYWRRVGPFTKGDAQFELESEEYASDLSDR